MNPRSIIGLVFLTACAAALAAGIYYRSLPVAETPLAEKLRLAPGVVRVEVALPASGTPARRIIHILDYHLVPRELYGPDGYAAHLDRVEAVQKEQIALLRWLASNRGVSEVFEEGLTEENRPAFFEKVRAADEMANAEIPRLMEQLADARASGAGRGLGLEKQIAVLMDEHREQLLSLGAAGRLCLAGKLDVQPLEDAAILEKTKTLVAGGRVLLGPRAAKARADAMVRNLLKSGEPAVVVVLSAGRDLSESIQDQDPQCGYIRVATRKVAELIGSR